MNLGGMASWVSPRDLPVVIGHRGAPGHLPEHTLASYRWAVELGAEAVEPDLVMTGDGVLILRHENELSRTTDVARRPEFADRLTGKHVDGRYVRGWFVEDFTLAEVKTLRAVERYPRIRPRSASSDGRHEVATFDELLLQLGQWRRRGREVGLYAEIKHSTYFAGIGLPLEQTVLCSLRDHGLDYRDSGVHLQSFETGNLTWLRDRTDVHLVQLVEATGRRYDDLVTPRGLFAAAKYADHVGIAKDRLLPRHSLTGPLYEARRLVDDAHLAGLRVLAFTLRDENCFLSERHRLGQDQGARGDVVGETRALLDLGVDGVFTDSPDTTIRARELWLGGLRQPEDVAEH